MFTGNKRYRWYLVTKALQNVIFERFRKGESAAGEKNRACREEIWILNPFLFFARRRRKFLGFSTLTKDMDTPPGPPVGSDVYGK